MKVTLDKQIKKSDNLQLLRFIAAIMVMCSHAFILTEGDGSREWFVRATGGQMTMGAFAVSVFFCAGGYLIARSAENSRTGKAFFKKRLIRLFPTLWTVVLICVLILGPAVTSLTPADYFRNGGTYKYFLNGLLILSHNLPGVFEKNPYTAAVNGSLWTLPVEFLCYIGCFAMNRLHLLKKQGCAVITAAAVLLYFVGIRFIIPVLGLEALLSAVNAVMLFYMGMMFWVFKDNIVMDKRIALGFLILLLLSIRAGIMYVSWPLFFPYLLFYLCFSVRQVSEIVGRLGNLSYGIYLAAFPVQQTLIQIAGGSMSPEENMLFSIPVTVIIALILYHAVEKKWA